MNKQYPCIGRTQLVRPQGLCISCGGNLSDMRIHVQHSIFRGEDDVFKCHKQCKEHAMQVAIGNFK